MNTPRLIHGLISAAALTCVAAPAKADDGSYSLFNPTPHLRELNTDRPDKTESPYTVDAGHFQLEMDLANFTHDRVKTAATNIKTDTYGAAPFNIKAGLTPNIDLQIVVNTYATQHVTDYTTGAKSTVSGFGDITVRTKINFWGNDGGSTAFGIMPFIKLPTAAKGLGNGKIEGGIILPLAVALPQGFDMGLMTEVDINHDELGTGSHAELVNSVTVGHDLTKSLGVYVELFTSKSTEARARWNNSADIGFTYGLTDNIQLDAGVNLGITEAADDLNTFVGLSVRW